MYSYEDRIQAVEFYIKLDKRVRPTIRQLGYIRWYNEKRIKISLGSLSPLEYRSSLGLTA